MPLEIQRTALVYRLWDDADLKDLFEDHAAADWLCALTCSKETGSVEWVVSLQLSAARQLITATRDEVIVSDLVTVTKMPLVEYNAAHPENTIEESGS